MSKALSIAEKSVQYTLFEWTAQRDVHPMVVAKGEGAYIWNDAGKRYLDFCSVSMNVNIGHGDTRVAEAVAQQMCEISMVSPFHTTAVRAKVAGKLVDVSPIRGGKVFFTLGGADANETALRMARLVTGRTKILARERAYHGGTHLALAVSGDIRQQALGFHGQDIARIPDPYDYRSDLANPGDESNPGPYLRRTEEIIKHEGPGTIAAVIVEPITGANGIIVPPRGWLSGLRELCDRYGILLICDEVMSGFGRTGRWFAVDHEGVVPDIMTMAKGLTSGYAPLGAVVVSPAVAYHFDDHILNSGLTLQSHPVGLAAARANLAIYESDHLIERAAAMGRVLLDGFQALMEKHPSVGDVRGLGLFTVMELVKNRETKEPLWGLIGESSSERTRFVQQIQAEGLLTAVKGSLVFGCPPLVISDADVDWALDVLDRGLDVADGSVDTVEVSR